MICTTRRRWRTILARRDKHGLDVRIVKHRDWRIDIADMEKAVDRKTKLISVSFVSSVNGHLEDLKKTQRPGSCSRGPYLFADIIQGCGATPLDVHAMGVDFASCGMYKWLQGEHGFGFLYVKERPAGHGRQGDAVHRQSRPELRALDRLARPRQARVHLAPSERHRAIRVQHAGGDQLRRPARVLPLHRGDRRRQHSGARSRADRPAAEGTSAARLHRHHAR